MDDSRIEEIIQKTVEAAQQRYTYQLTLIEKHEHLLYGNGKEGLTTIVDRLERAVEAAQKVFMAVITVLVISGVIGLFILLVRFNLLKP